MYTLAYLPFQLGNQEAFYIDEEQSNNAIPQSDFFCFLCLFFLLVGLFVVFNGVKLLAYAAVFSGEGNLRYEVVHTYML